MDYGRALRIARAARGISQKEISNLSGLKPSYLSMLERGGRKNPSLETISKIASALDLPVPLFILLSTGKDERREFKSTDLDDLARSLVYNLLGG